MKYLVSFDVMIEADSESDARIAILDKFPDGRILSTEEQEEEDELADDPDLDEEENDISSDEDLDDDEEVKE